MFDLAPRKSNYPSLWSPLSLFKDLDSYFKTSSNLYFSEEGDYSVVECDLPGVEKDQVKVTFNEERGYVTVEASNESERNKRSYRYTFSVNPGDVDTTTEPQLSLKNGVLTIKFKKSEEKKSEGEKEKVLKIE